MTDLHPDLHYSSKSSVERACHGKKSKQKSDRAGYWGSPFTECDAPWRLTNFTLDYLDENWADQVDFVICESLFFVGGWHSSCISRVNSYVISRKGQETTQGG